MQSTGARCRLGPCFEAQKRLRNSHSFLAACWAGPTTRRYVVTHALFQLSNISPHTEHSKLLTSRRHRFGAVIHGSAFAMSARLNHPSRLRLFTSFAYPTEGPMLTSTTVCAC